MAPEVQDTLESSTANPGLVDQWPPEQEAYVIVDVLKNFMTTINETILQQLHQQVKKTTEAMTFMRLFPAFDYVPTAGCKPSHSVLPLLR